jgi:hypothetical protein
MVDAPKVPWRVASVTPMDGYRLRIRFNDSTNGGVDLLQRVADPNAGVFADLRDPALFARASVKLGTVSWPCGIDLPPDAMHDAIRRDGIWAPDRCPHRDE